MCISVFNLALLPVFKVEKSAWKFDEPFRRVNISTETLSIIHHKSNVITTFLDEGSQPYNLRIHWKHVINTSV